jgi:hypothetical protein
MDCLYMFIQYHPLSLYHHHLQLCRQFSAQLARKFSCLQASMKSIHLAIQSVSVSVYISKIFSELFHLKIVANNSEHPTSSKHHKCKTFYNTDYSQTDSI